MARNGSGTYVLPNTFASLATITAAGHNENYSDIAAEITNSLALDGQSTMSGVIKAANGTASAPAYTFGSDTNTGIYRIGADEIGVAVNATKILDIASTGLTITGTLTATGGIGTNSVVTASITDANVTTAKLADSAVTTAKIADANVTSAKMAANSVVTAAITDANVTYAKIQNVANGKVLGNFSGGAAAPSEYSVKDIRPLYHLQEQQSSGTGSSNAQSSGSYSVVVLNAEVTKEISGASLSSNTITLPAGTYWMEAAMPVQLNSSNVPGRSKLRLQDTTNNLTKVGPGLMGFTVNVYNLANLTTLSGRFTLSGSTNLQLQIRPEYSMIAVGALSWSDTNVYAELKIWKEA